MAFSVTGYVLEKPRVGTSNSPFTSSPDNVVSDPSAFDAAFPSSEENPRTEYLTLVLSDGDLANAEFGWTKNEVVNRFDWDGQGQRFRTLPGAPPITIGTLSPTANTTRLKVSQIPADPAKLSPSVAPFRISVGTTGSGVSFVVDVVADDAALVAPGLLMGHVRLSLTTGNLAWASTDLSSYNGQAVRFQPQSFFSFKESTGHIGDVGGTILLSPIPGAGQKPLVRIGFGLWLTPVQVFFDFAFSSNPAPGTFEWSLATGKIKFNSTDVAAFAGLPVYYDGVLFEKNLRLPSQSLSTVASPSSIFGVPSAGSDLVFRATSTLLTGGGTIIAPNQLQDSFSSLTSVAKGDVVTITSAGPYFGTRRKVTAVAGQVITVQPPFPIRGSVSYAVERLHIQFPETVRVDSFASVPAPPAPGAGQVEVDSLGAVQLSAQDVANYGSLALSVVFGDLPIERGVSLRLFRTPVDPSGTEDAYKDVSAFYSVEGATLASPIQPVPLLFLPSVPVDDPAFPTTITVEQGTGSYTGQLARLDTPSPSAGLGYFLDPDKREFHFAQRKNGVIVQLPSPVGATALPDPLIDPDNLSLTLDQGAGPVALTLGTDALLDAQSGLLSFVATQGTVLFSGQATLASSSLTDPSQNFSSVTQGDLVVIASGSAKGVYTVLYGSGASLYVQPAFLASGTGVSYEVRRGKETLADRFFQEVSLADPATKVERIRALGVTQNSPRLSVATADAAKIRFRFGGSTFSSSVVTVANDGSFTNPASLSPQVVEVSLATGHLNFSSSDVASSQTVYAVLLLTEQKDYRLDAVRGLVQVTERLLSNDELLLSYIPLDSSGNALPPVVERGTFLVRKEVGSHPSEGNTVTFNPLGRTVASNPPPQVYRGGRPQSSAQVLIDTATSTVTFQPDTQATDALPHGAVVEPDERIYIDYYVYEAIGGENTTSVLQPPMRVTQLTLTDGSSSFTLPGNRISDFPTLCLLRVAGSEVYLLQSPYYDGTNTTISLVYPQTFRSDQTRPKIEVSSGPTRVLAGYLLPSYFVLESSYETVPRGMNKVRVPGDATASYRTGTVLVFVDGGGSPLAFYAVTGASYDSERDRTEITLATNTFQQFTPGTHQLRRSLRPIYDSVTKEVQTARVPILTESYTVFRQVEGQVGQVLAAGTDYTIDDGGKVTFTSALGAGEEFSIFYVGHTLVSGQLTASYTTSIAPNASNGLAGQTLSANYWVFNPDTFFYRVETLTNFRGEVAEQYKTAAKASVPSFGPVTSNASGQKLYEQGRESVFFSEGRLKNEDVVARATLKFYNDLIHYLEDVLQNLDGRVVGDYDGRFQFDGSTGAEVASFDLATNQIDDRIKISDFPVLVQSISPLVTVSIGTWLRAWEPSAFSRFYPTRRVCFGVATDGMGGGGSNPATGTPIVDFETKNLTSVSTIARRAPRARVMSDAVVGQSTLQVDHADAQSDPVLRPTFAADMRLVIPGYVDDPSYVTVTAVSSTSISFTPALTVAVPRGATITLSASDSVSNTPAGYQKTFRPGFDLGVDLEKGQLSYVQPYFPFDGTFPGVPAELSVQTPDLGDQLQAEAGLMNSETAPVKFPALYGEAVDDDGDQRVPLINPSLDQETGSYTLEAQLITALQAVTAPFTGSGTLNVARTQITSTTVFGSPAPQAGDLVAITSGANADFSSPHNIASYRRIASVVGSVITIESGNPFPYVDAGTISYVVGVSTSVASGAGTASFPSSTRIKDLGATFITAGVLPGYTVVILSGAGILTRRQVLYVASQTEIEVDQPFTSLVAGQSYRITKSLLSYGVASQLSAALVTEKSVLSVNDHTIDPTVINSELVAIGRFFDLVFTDLLSPATHSASVSGTALTATDLVDFTAAGIDSSHYVYIESGSNAGVYPVSAVGGPTSLSVETAFPVAGSVSYRICKAFGVGKKTLAAVSSVQGPLVDFVASVDAMLAIVDAAPVIGSGNVTDLTMYATRVYPSDLTARLADITTRQTDVTSAVAALSAALSSGERLYDKRYAWIDARVNLEKGLLPKIARAAADRVKAQTEALNQLIKLLAVES
jgi:hypothetical protein